MTTNTPAKIARYAFDVTRGEAFQIAHGAYVTHTDHLAAVQAAERRAVERCARAIEKLYRSEPTGIDDGWTIEGVQKRVRERCAAAIRALDLGASKEE